MSEALKQIMAERDLSRAITALYLEVDESIVNDIRIKVDAAFQSVRDERDRLRSTIRTLCSSGNRLLDDLIGRSEAAESFKYHVKQAQAALTSAGGQERANDSHIG